MSRGQKEPSRRAVLVAGLAAVPLTACSGTASSGTGPTSSGPTAGGSTTAPGTTGAATATGTPGASGTAAASTPSISGGSGTARAAGPDITHGPRTGNAVALTFHGAGDAAILTGMLAAFKEADAHVTVLAIGQWLAAETDLAKKILDAGHDLGNHTWSHQTMPRLSAAQAQAEIDRAAAELRTLTGSAGRWFRPSGTPKSTPVIRAAALKAGYGACLAYDVDPLDYTDPGAAAVARNVAAAIKPGSIVSLHLGHPGTLAAMPQILDTLKRKGLRAVTATTLLGAS